MPEFQPPQGFVQVPVAEGFLGLPDLGQLGSLQDELQDAIESVHKLVAFLEKYGKYIPGSSGILGPLTLLDRSLGLVEGLLKFIPG